MHVSPSVMLYSTKLQQQNTLVNLAVHDQSTKASPTIKFNTTYVICCAKQLASLQMFFPPNRAVICCRSFLLQKILLLQDRPLCMVM